MPPKIKHFFKNIPTSERSENDVLCGTGSGPNSWPGNIAYREFVKNRREEYKAAKHRTKRAVAADVVAEIRALDPPGRFLKKDKNSNLWFDIGDDGSSGAIEKAGRLLRDMDKASDAELETEKKSVSPTVAFIASKSGFFGVKSLTSCKKKSIPDKSKLSRCAPTLSEEEIFQVQSDLMGTAPKKKGFLSIIGGKRNKEHKKKGQVKSCSAESWDEIDRRRVKSGDTVSTASRLTEQPSLVSYEITSTSEIVNNHGQVTVSEEDGAIDKAFGDDSYKNVKSALTRSNEHLPPLDRYISNGEYDRLNLSFSSAGSGPAPKILRLDEQDVVSDDVDMEIGDRAIDELIHDLDLDNDEVMLVN